MALFPYKKLQKGTSDMSNPYVHSTFTLLLIKQIFEKNKSSKGASESRTQFWPRITHGNTRKSCEICSKLTMKIPKRRH